MTSSAAKSATWRGLDANPPILRSRTLRAEVDAAPSRFADPVWDLTPGIHARHLGSMALYWRRFPTDQVATFKRCFFLLIDEADLPSIPKARSRGLSLRTIHDEFSYALLFANWLSKQGLTLATFGPKEAQTYLEVTIRRDWDNQRKARSLLVVKRIHACAKLLPPLDRMPIGILWGNVPATSLVDYEPGPWGNRTPRIDAKTMEPLLGWALRVIDNCGADVVRAFRTHQYVRPRPGRHARISKNPGQRVLGHDVFQYLDWLEGSGQPMPATRAGGKPDGHFVPDYDYIAAMLGTNAPGLRRLHGTTIAASQLPLSLTGLDRILGTINGVPWRNHPITKWDVYEEVQHVVTACLVVISYLSGMRPGEVLNLQRGCCSYDSTLNLWLIRAHTFKGARQADGRSTDEGVERATPWVVVEPVSKAVALLESLHDEMYVFPSGFKHRTMHGKPKHHTVRGADTSNADIRRFISWINDEVAPRVGLETIPADPHGAPTLARFRRTLAWFIVRRPGGLIAAAIQYGHVHVGMILGYAGTADAGWEDEYGLERVSMMFDEMNDRAQDLRKGAGVSGPSAAVYKDRVEKATFLGRTITGRSELRRLLSNPDLQVFHGEGMTCVFDPSKAKCLASRDGDGVDGPSLPDCDDSCQNVARTDADVSRLRQELSLLNALRMDSGTPNPLRIRAQRQAREISKVVASHAARPSEGR